MKLLELNLVEFGGLRDRHIELGDGLNLISGENEAGKSTLLLFIKFMLYGLPRRGQEDRDRSVNWQSHRAEGSMTLSHEGVTYRIERSFVEMGARSVNDKVIVYRLDTGEIVFLGQDPGEAILGVPKEIFESSCAIGQMQCANLGGKKGAEAIRNLLSSADEKTDLSHIETRLDKIRVLYRHKTGNGGRIYTLNTKLNEARQALNQARQTQQELALLEAKSEREQRRFDLNTERLAEVGERLTQIGKLHLLDRFEALREREAQVAETEQKILSRQASAMKNDRELTDADAASLRSLAEQLRSVRTRVSELDTSDEAPLRAENADAIALAERMEAEGGAVAVAQSIRRKRRGLRSLWILGGILALPFIIGAILLIPYLAAGLLLTLGLWIAALCGGAKVKRKAAPYGKTVKEFPDYLDACAEALNAHRAEQKEYAERIAKREALLSLQRETEAKLAEALALTLPENEFVPDIDTAEAEAERILVVLREISELKQQKLATEQLIFAERERLSSYDERALRESLPPDLEKEKEGEGTRLEWERKALERQGEVLAQSLRQAQISLISLRAGAEDPMELADKVQRLTEACYDAEEYYESLQMAQEALTRAAEHMSGNLTPALSRRAGEMIDYISDGRYKVLRTGADYLPSLLGEDRMTVSAERLSGGTRDAAYLSLRIALVTELFSGELPPLIMDDALCQIDDRRAEQILKLLSRLSEDRFQTLLFTCHRREAEICQAASIPHTPISL